MINSDLTLGLDVGSATLAFVLVDSDGKVIDKAYVFHHGNIQTILEQWAVRETWHRIRRIGVNDQGAPFLNCGAVIDDRVAVLEGLKENAVPRGILLIGAENFGLMLLDDGGQYQKTVTNTGCAAGTGSFLDQQARRRGLKDSSQLAKRAA